jgi:glycosyltransferase involved in cell wall biosynthesis
MNERVKNHPALLRAAATLLQDIQEVEFILVGDGRLRPELEKMAEQLGITGHVVFLGERPDIRAVLASLDISVLTSTSESMPNAVLEAMAAGLPVVATRVGGTPEVVRQGETGFLVDPDDDTGFVEVLRTLLINKDLRQRFGAAGQRAARSQFGAPAIKKKYEELYAAALFEQGADGKLAPESA